MGTPRAGLLCVLSILTVEILELKPNPATEEFDQLCFDYGLELDEDVRSRASVNL